MKNSFVCEIVMKMCYEFNIIHNSYCYEPVMKNVCHDGYEFIIIENL